MPRRRALLRAAALATAAPAWPAAIRPASAQRRGGPALAPLPLAVKPDDTVAPGWRRGVLARWGDRVAFDAPAWDPARPDAAAAAAQFGWDARIVDLLAAPAAADGAARAVLVVAHPTVEARMAFPGGRDRPAVAAAAQGASLLNLERTAAGWIVVDGGYQNRRLTADTLCRVAGPGAARGAVRGLLGVSGGCATPWGTLLLTEDDPQPWAARLRGLDARFGDPSGFGLVAELDPLDPQSVPAKRTALGRFAFGDARAALAPDGRAVVYLTDRRPAGLLLRFVSAGPAAGPDALDAGTLAVARVEGERLSWLDLPPGAGPDGAAAAGSRLETPSGLALDGAGRLYLACRGGIGRPSGQVLQFEPDGGPAGPGGALRPLFVAGDPRRPGGVARYGAGAAPLGPTAWPEAPSTLAAGPGGMLWVGTDHGGPVAEAPDALYGCPTAGALRGVPLPVYGAPRAAGIGGAAVSPDGGTLFAAVRAPGAEPGATWDGPGTRWPAFEAGAPPRSAVVALSREDGGPVG